VQFATKINAKKKGVYFFVVLVMRGGHKKLEHRMHEFWGHMSQGRLVPIFAFRT